ncbi:MAG TPA: hypothetical protein VLU43_13015 [Anaeromyxobacteraceae bacterium]|nr:hypothetical protein [Anaeromyxobacteraceae bacterium]
MRCSPPSRASPPRAPEACLARPPAGSDEPSGARQATLAARAARIAPLVAAAAFVGLLALARATQRRLVTDLWLSDESYYLSLGKHLLRDGFPRAEWAPVYTAWYWVGSLLHRDPIDLYYANWPALLFAFLLVAWSVLHAAGVRGAPAAAVLAVLSPLALLATVPYVGLLSGALCGIAVAAAMRAPSPSAGFSRASVALALATFVRPELALATVLVLAAVPVAARAEGAPAAILARRIAIPAGVLAALSLAFGLPLGGGRSFEAFGQHFALHLAHAQGWRGQPWEIWRTIVREQFGAAATVGQAFAANPTAFLGHVARNLLTIPRLAGAFSPELVAGPEAFPVGGAVVAIVAAGVLIGAVRIWRAIRGPGVAPEDRRRAIALAVVAASVAAPSALAVAVIYPREHYLLSPLLPLLAVSAHGWTGLAGRLPARFRAALASRTATVVAAALALALLPAADGTWPWFRALGVHDERVTYNVYVGDSLRRLSFVDPRPMVVLDTDFGLGLYAGWNSIALQPHDCEVLARCLAERRPDVILLGGPLVAHYRSLGDPTIATLAAEPQRFGYRPAMEVPGADVTVLVGEGAGAYQLR